MGDEVVEKIVEQIGTLTDIARGHTTALQMQAIVIENLKKKVEKLEAELKKLKPKRINRETGEPERWQNR